MVTCETCNDTHMMSLGERMVLCTRCPTPCRDCAQSNGTGAYCTVTPCTCHCHTPGPRHRPKTDEWWRHTNGNRYQVLGLANDQTQHPDRYPVTVIYQGENGNIWCRPLHDWHRSMTKEPTPGLIEASDVKVTPFPPVDTSLTFTTTYDFLDRDDDDA